MLFLLSLLVGVIVGDIWPDSGIWIVVLFSLIMCFWIWKKKILLIWIIAACFVGFFWSVFTIQSFQNHRDTLGESVGWNVTTHTVEWTARELISTSEFKRKYRFIIDTIDTEKVWPYEVMLLLPTNLSVTNGDHVVAQGKFDFPKDTPDYAA